MVLVRGRGSENQACHNAPGLLVISDQPFVVLVRGRGSENQACHSAPGLIGDK